MIAALYVLWGGPYFGLSDIDPWDLDRDARKYRGPHRVIAHPPCKRWGRYWSGGPSAHEKRIKGDDDGCFAHALWSVRTFGGIIEHPEASHAWKWFGLERPPRSGGWISADQYGGYTCCVAQGHYGHRAQKLTWLYGVGINRHELEWGLCPGKDRLDSGSHYTGEKRKHRFKRTTPEQNDATPVKFRNLLMSCVISNKG